MNRRRYIPISEALRLAGDQDALLMGLQQGDLRARGRFVVENDAPREPELLSEGNWYDGALQVDTSSLLLKQEGNLPGTFTHAAFVQIEVEAKGFKKWLGTETKSKGGRPVEHDWKSMDSILRQLAKSRGVFASATKAYDAARVVYNGNHAHQIADNSQLRKRFKDLLEELDLISKS